MEFINRILGLGAGGPCLYENLLEIDIFVSDRGD